MQTKREAGYGVWDGKQNLSRSALGEDVGKVSSVLFPCLAFVISLNPVKMASNKEACSAKVLRLLVNAERVKEEECDTLLQQFATFLDSIPAFGSERFANFQSAKDRVDTIFFECMANESYKSQ